MRSIIAGIVAIASTVSVHAAPAPKDKTAGEKLLGTWKLVRGDQPIPKAVTYFVEFTKDGKMSLRIQPNDPNGTTTTLTGTYKLDGDKIDYTLTIREGTKKQEILTIKKLSETELVTTDPEGIKEEFERVKSDKEGRKD